VFFHPVSTRLLASQENTIDRASRAAETFWQQFTAVQGKERVAQSKLKADGKPAETHIEEFDYLAFLTATNRGLSVEESRVSRAKTVEEKRTQLLITSGFPTFLLMFHPEFRDRFDFAELPANSGNAVRRITFSLKRGAQSLSGLKLKDRVYAIPWKGTAMLDPESGAIRRIEATLGAPMDDLGLSELHVELDYQPTALAGTTQIFWLPVRAAISLQTPRQAWRNVHEFSDYKRFSVTTSTRDSQTK
jgi:hypothetical protein